MVLGYYIAEAPLLSNHQYPNTMKHNDIKIIIGGMLLLCLPGVASAQYFIADGLGYNILSAAEHTVEVTVNETCTTYSGTFDIPSTVTYLGESYDVVALGEMAFYRAALSGLTIPSSVTEIRQGCFRDATGLATIHIPATVTHIDVWALAANGLASIEVDEGNPNYGAVDGILYSKDTATLVQCPRGKSGAIALPQATRHIAPCAFFDCKRVTGVALPDGLASIDYWAFMGAIRLNNIVIPATATYLGDNLFAGCTALTDLTLEAGNTHYYMDGTLIYTAGGDTLVSAHKSTDSVFLPGTVRVVSGFGFNTNVRYVRVPEGATTIGSNAFAYSSLRSIDLPSRMERIGAYAFDYCTALTRVGMPDSLDTMGRGCFELCSRLTTISIPDGLRTIPHEAFMYCTSLADIDWGCDVETIDSYAFGNCAITGLHLPPSLRIIRNGAFWRGRKMDRVVFYAPVDTIEHGAFDDHPIGKLQFRNTLPPATTEEGSLYGTTVDCIIVPCGSLDVWLADGYWSRFESKYVEDCDGIDDVADAAIRVCVRDGRIEVLGAEGEAVAVYDLAGRNVANHALPTGVYLVRVGHRPARKVTVAR